MRRISEQRLRDLLLLLACRPDRAAAIAWWRLLGKKLRARARLETAIAALPLAHERWVAAIGNADLSELADARASPSADALPLFCVHLHCAREDDSHDLRSAASSLMEQSHAPLRVLLTKGDDSTDFPFAAEEGWTVLPGTFATRMEALCTALEAAKALGASWLVPLDASTRLPRHALAAYGAHLLNAFDGGEAVLLYGHEEAVADTFARRQLWFKPAFDPRMVLSQDYLSASCALATAAALGALRRCGRELPTSLFELALRMAWVSPVTAIQRVERIVARTKAGAWQARGGESVNAVQRLVGDTAQAAPGPFGTVELQYPLADPAPSVTIVIATRDRVELLRTCLNGLLNETAYPNFDIIIVDNGSVEPETLAYMDHVAAEARVTVVRWPHQFNYSAINNFAASHARGEYLCLLNNDIEVLDPAWLGAMVREALQPGVGAVGARLLYPDRSIQHAGVAIGIGNAAGHAHRGLPEGQPGYFAQALIARGASAVTGACLLVAKRHFDAVGGLDEKRLAVAYNDVDLCLKLRGIGLRNIYTPFATLIHHESKSRGLDFAPEHLVRYMQELKVFQKRWGTTDAIDPWHHQRLDRASEIYTP